MTDFSDWGTAARAVTDPSTSAADLAAIAQAQPGLRAQVAAHPNAYPGLLQWLVAQGDPAVQAVAASRLQPQTPIAAPMPVAPQQMPWGAPQPAWGAPAAVAPQRRSAAPVVVALAIIVLVGAIVGLVLWHPWQNSDTAVTPTPSPTSSLPAPCCAPPTPGYAPSPSYAPSVTYKPSSTPYTPSASVPGGNVAARDVQVGACFTDTNGDSIDTISTVPCSETHDSEVFLNQVNTSSTYPTDSEWTAFAQQYCIPAFQSYVGIDYDSSSLDINYLVPDSTSWGQGDKTLTCYATDPNGGLVSSVKGSGM